MIHSGLSESLIIVSHRFNHNCRTNFCLGGRELSIFDPFTKCLTQGPYHSDKNVPIYETNHLPAHRTQVQNFDCPLFTSKSAVLAGNIRVKGSLCNRAKLDNISIIYQARYRE